MGIVLSEIIKINSCSYIKVRLLKEKGGNKWVLIDGVKVYRLVLKATNTTVDII